MILHWDASHFKISIAPTLEELDKILNFSKEKAYTCIGQTIDTKILAKGLGIPYPEFSLNYKKEG